MFNLSLTVRDTDYGLGEVIPEILNKSQLERELFCYSILRGDWGKHKCSQLGINPKDFKLSSTLQHFINATVLLWPNDVDIRVRGYWNTNLVDVLDEFCNSDDVGLAGNASSSKTFGMGVFGIVDWLAEPFFTSTFVASITLGGSDDRIWGQMVDLYRKCHPRIGKFGTIVDYKHMIVAEDNYKDDGEDESTGRVPRNSIKALAFPPGNEGLKAVKNCRGRKNKRVRLFVDENADMDMYVNDTRVNFGANIDFIYGAAGNPDARANPHKELCRPDHPLGYDSVSKEHRRWKTRTGTCLFLNGEKSPNFQAPPGEPPPFPYLLTRKNVEKMLKLCHGNVNHLQYWRNVIGYWPDSSAELSIIPESLIKNSGLNVEPRWSRGQVDVVCGFDPAFTLGGDRCAATFFKMGSDETGRKVLFYIGTKTYDGERGEVFEHSIARALVQDCIKAGVKPKHFGMDISGDGGKMMQAIIIEWLKTDSTAPEIKAISSMGSPTTRMVSSKDRRRCEDAYDRLVTEYWHAFYSAISVKVLYGLDLNLHQDIISELCSRTYYIKNKKISVETKKEMKERIGKSPDLADSAIYACEVARREGLLLDEPRGIHIEQEEIDAFERRYILNRDEANLEAVSYGGDSFDPDGF